MGRLLRCGWHYLLTKILHSLDGRWELNNGAHPPASLLQINATSCLKPQLPRLLHLELELNNPFLPRIAFVRIFDHSNGERNSDTLVMRKCVWKWKASTGKDKGFQCQVCHSGQQNTNGLWVRKNGKSWIMQSCSSIEPAEVLIISKTVVCYLYVDVPRVYLSVNVL